MVRYLSDEWMQRAADVLGGTTVPEGTELTVHYEVTGSGDGKRNYTLEAADGTLRLTPGKRKDAPVNFTLDYDTAAEIARGELSAQVAFMQGRLKLGGDIRVLIDGAGALESVDDALGDLRADTEY